MNHCNLQAIMLDKRMNSRLVILIVSNDPGTSASIKKKTTKKKLTTATKTLNLPLRRIPFFNN